MAKISANGSKGHHKFTLTVNEISTSEANNTSTVSFSFTLSPLQSGWDWANWTNPNRCVSYDVNINGSKYTGTIPNYDGKSTVTLKSGTQIVEHNSDGTKTITFHFNVYDSTGATYTCGAAFAIGTLALTTLKKTVSGGAPIITARVQDVNDSTVALTGDNSKLILNHSNAKAVMSATPQGGAVMNEDLYIIRNGNETGYGTSHIFEKVESAFFRFSAEDSGGNIGTKELTADIVDYIRLTCNVSQFRPDASGTMTILCNGNYFNGSFGARENSLSVEYVCSGSDGSYNSGTMSVSLSGNAYTATATLSGLDYQTTYEVAIKSADKLETVLSVKNGIRSKPIFHWGEYDFVFEVPVTFNSDDEMIIKGDLRLKGDENYGNILYFGDASHCYIAEETDDCMTIKAKDLNLLISNDYKINGNPVFGSWTPTLLGGVASSYEVQEGWYQRLGNVVTIGWQIKATINSGYHNSKLSIVGSPFIPKVSAFGGGVAFNVYTGAGWIFEGWSIDTTAQITARLQSCNKDAAGNLEISSTCYYPNGGGVVSLGGTISYTV